jgi:hypothetical protein
LAYFFALQGLQGLQAAFALHGLQALHAAFALHGLHAAFFAAQGLQALQAASWIVVSGPSAAETAVGSSTTVAAMAAMLRVVRVFLIIEAFLRFVRIGIFCLLRLRRRSVRGGRRHLQLQPLIAIAASNNGVEKLQLIVRFGVPAKPGSIKIG